MVENTVTASIQYLAQDEQHQLVKPYYLYLDYDADLPPTNTAADEKLVQIHDARQLMTTTHEMFAEFGFALLPLKCSLTPEEHWHHEWVERVLYPKYESMARSLFPDAARVEVLEHAVSKGVRKRRYGEADGLDLDSQTASGLVVGGQRSSSHQDKSTQRLCAHR